MKRLFAAVAFLTSVAGCSPRPASTKPVDYFPLATGHEWLYRVMQPAEPDRLLQFRIVGEAAGDRGETRFLLDNSGSRFYLRHGDVVGYSISPDIWTIFLSGPVARGNRFDGALAAVADFRETPDGEARPASEDLPPMQILKSSGYKTITEVGKKISVPAGTFVDCVEVSHFAGHTMGVKYFAPRVGMVFAEAWFVDPETQERSRISTQELIGYRVGKSAGGSLDPVLPVAPSPDSEPTDSPTP